MLILSTGVTFARHLSASHFSVALREWLRQMTQWQQAAGIHAQSHIASGS